MLRNVDKILLNEGLGHLNPEEEIVEENSGENKREEPRKKRRRVTKKIRNSILD